MTFGERLKSLREEQGLSQQQLADKLKLSQSAIAYYETNARQPGQSILEQLADFYHVSIDYILGRSEFRNPDILSDPEVISLILAHQKMTPEQRAKWDRINKEIFPEAFGNNDK